jgi:hypothetical protein
LNVIEQFSPVNSFSRFCPNTGSVYLTQGNSERAALAALRTGATFTTEFEVGLGPTDSIFGCGTGILIASARLGPSVCLDLGHDCIEIHPKNFRRDLQTIGVVPLGADSFLQVSRHSCHAIGSDFRDLSYDSEILAVAFSKTRMALVFSDSVEVLSMDLTHEFRISLDHGDAVCAGIYADYLAVAFLDSHIQLFKKDVLVGSTRMAPDSFCQYLVFMVHQRNLELFLVLQDGLIFQYTIPDLVLSNRLSSGYLVKNAFLLDSETLFVNSSSPALLYSSKSTISVLCPPHLTSCVVGKRVALLVAANGLLVGEVNRTSACSLEQRPCSSRPLLFSIHEQPLALFVTFLEGTSFLVSAFLLPSFAVALTESVGDQEEVTALCYHVPLAISLFGTVLGEKGTLCAVAHLLNEFKVVCRLDIEGGVFCLMPLGSAEILVGGHCRVVRVGVTTSAAGFFEMTAVQRVDTNVIPRSLSFVGNFILHFGMVRSIGVLERAPNGTLSKIHDHFLASKMHTGVSGVRISDHAGHLFVVDTARTLTIYSFKVSRKAETTVKIAPLTTYILDSPAASFSMVRDGFAMLATRDGALLTLVECDRHTIRSLNSIAREIGGILPFDVTESAIADLDRLSLFSKLSRDVQDSIATAIKMPARDIATLIQDVTRSIGHICSTL